MRYFWWIVGTVQIVALVLLATLLVEPVETLIELNSGPHFTALNGAEIIWED